MSFSRLFAFAALAGLLAVPAAAQHRPNEARDMMRSFGGGGLTGKKLDKAIAKAAAHPLGSKLNPVRENMPQGQIAYLRRLRCADGTPPAFTRRGSMGVGVFGNIVDAYSVTCPGKPTQDIHIDMYHDGPETRPVPGFTIGAERNAASI
ncbi:MAG TPA: hypothetical protein VGB62_04400 [Allosphingosinicella sp.]|jgi:hypothetical protein